MIKKSVLLSRNLLEHIVSIKSIIVFLFFTGRATSKEIPCCFIYLVICVHVPSLLPILYRIPDTHGQKISELNNLVMLTITLHKKGLPTKLTLLQSLLSTGWF